MDCSILARQDVQKTRPFKWWYSLSVGRLQVLQAGPLCPPENSARSNWRLALGLGSDPGLAGPRGDMVTLIAEGEGCGQGVPRLVEEREGGDENKVAVSEPGRRQRLRTESDF
jgi:hypothetical protein